MPQAIVDPDDLRQFAMTLRKFNSQLRQSLTSLNHQLGVLGTTWRDQEHKRFVEQFENYAKVIARFTEDGDQHVRYLIRKAEHIDEYLKS